MAQLYDILTQRQTKELVGHDLIDVWEIGARSKPSGVYFAFRVTPDRHTAAEVDAEASELAQSIEGILSHPNVSSVAYVQSINSTGGLSDECDVHYASTDGRHRGQLRVPFRGLTPETIDRHVGEAVSHLADVAGL